MVKPRMPSLAWGGVVRHVCDRGGTYAEGAPAVDKAGACECEARAVEGDGLGEEAGEGAK